jgi:hypothetical protein
MASQKIRIELQFERHSDGRYFVTSDDVPGFRMAGTDIEAIQKDLDEVVKDLLRLNSNFVVEELTWVPSLDEAKRHLQSPSPDGRAVYIAIGQIAA